MEKTEQYPNPKGGGEGFLNLIKARDANSKMERCPDGGKRSGDFELSRLSVQIKTNSSLTLGAFCHFPLSSTKTAPSDMESSSYGSSYVSTLQNPTVVTHAITCSLEGEYFMRNFPPQKPSTGSGGIGDIF